MTVRAGRLIFCKYDDHKWYLEMKGVDLMKPVLRSTCPILAVLLMATVGFAQTDDQLIAQLSGRTQGPERDAAQLSQAYEKAVAYLMPRMGADDVSARYADQILLQDMALYASRPGAERERQALAKVLAKSLDQSMPVTVQYWLLLQLQRMGGAEAVPALARRLESDDPTLRDYARRALEKNPDRGAETALLKALEEATSPVWQAALIRSLGERQDPAGVKAISEALYAKDPLVLNAAVGALVRIASADVAAILTDGFEKTRGETRAVFGRGLFDLAQQIEKGNPQEAGRLYEAVFQGMKIAGVRSVQAAALYGWMRCDPDKAIDELLPLLIQRNPQTQAIAINAVRSAPTLAPLHRLAQEIARLEPEALVRLLGVIRDQGDSSFLESVQPLLDSRDETVRLAAIDTLAALGEAAEVPVLLQLAAGPQGDIQKAAFQGLTSITGDGVDDALKAQAADGTSEVRVAAIGLLAERQMDDVSSLLLRCGAETDRAVAQAAFKALETRAGVTDVPALVGLIIDPPQRATREYAVTTLRAVLARAAEPEAGVRTVIQSTETAKAAVQAELLSTLSAVGGGQALDYVKEQTLARNKTVQEAALRTLCDWSKYEAVAPLLVLVRSADTATKYHVLGLRGIVRLIQQSKEISLDQRTEDCLMALDAARRPEEKKLALAALGTLPTKQAGDRLLAQIESGELRNEAGLALTELARAMRGSNRRGARDLAQALVDLDISDDVTRRAQALLR
jgi:HEAT repeat protein